DGSEIFVSLYGEVQKEVIQATLADGYGIEVSFRETTTIRIERPVGTGAAAEFIGTAPMNSAAAPVPTGRSMRIVVVSRKLTSMPYPSASVAWMTSFCTSPYSDTKISDPS